MRILYLISTILLLTHSAFGQSDSIDFEKLHSKKLVKLLKSNDLYTTEDLSDIEISCYSPAEDSMSFSSHTKTFLIEADIDRVWEAYKSVSPTDRGSKKDMVNFGMLYGENGNRIYYREDAYDGLREGQLVFWNLRIWGGLAKISVGQVINEVNNEERYFEICYLSQGTSHGSQYIHLYETEEGFTKVVHYTRFRSSSKFRDRRLYPGLHEKAITEFHETIKEKVEEDVL